MRFFVSEVIQTSAMDCGPASLKALLEGFGVTASYGRLREACFTGVDGTSIDQIEDAAVKLGLEAEQIMLPADHVLLDEAGALPALVVVRLASGATHFVVAWRRCGPWIQLMDPGTGRQWRTREEFLSDLYIHTQAAASEAWREWAGSPDFLRCLERQLRKLGLAAQAVRRIIDAALRDETPHSLSAVDAAARLVESLAVEGAVTRGPRLAVLLESLIKRPETIPGSWWSARCDPADPNRIIVRGAVLMRVNGVRKAAGIDRSALSTEFADALAERPRSPLKALWQTLRADGMRFQAAVAAGLALAAAGVVAEAVLFRGIFDLTRSLAVGSQRWWAIGAMGLFLAAVTLLEYAVTRAILNAGRKFEGVLRLQFLTKIPRLADAYFRSRLMSDMADRAHSAHRLRDLPSLVADLGRAVFGLMFTVAGIAWLYPASGVAALAAAGLAVAVPLATRAWLDERDMRARSHAGALSQFFLDAMLGLTAVRAHGAGKAIARQHENLLGEWARAALSAGRSTVVVQTLQSALCLAPVIWLLVARLGSNEGAGGLLLLVYWAMSIPALGQEIVALTCQYPRLRNTLLRFTEPLGAREGEPVDRDMDQVAATDGVAIEMNSVRFASAGHTILEDLSVRIDPGEHVAIVGASGAGKSSLAGLLLGWNRPSDGEVRVDGEALGGMSLSRLRRSTVWISPQVQLWNRSLFDNLQYGADDGGVASDAVLDEAELTSVIEKLPQGMQTPLGESGRLLSGGEGQRVRFGRSLRRSEVRLAIMDEAFRGLERGRRRTLLETARRRWKKATLLHITHDIGETCGFDRVLVMDGGRIVEDGSPQELLRRAGSRYHALMDAEESARERVWSAGNWRTFGLDEGRLREELPSVRRKEAVC
ncbi:MAG: ATP-binding cassette domain-containing protein [Bryobacteraceae bacterium]